MSREFLDRIVPTHLLELPRAPRGRTLQRIPQPVGVIGHLKPGLAARAELSLVNGVPGIAFQLLGEAHFKEPQLPAANNFSFTFHHAHQRAAARRTKGTDTRLPGRNARHQIFFWNEPDELVLGIPATVERCRCTRQGRDFEEVTTLHGKSESRH